MKTGSIVLETVRYFTGIVPSKGSFSIELLSTNLSGDTTFSVQGSLSGDNWDNLQESGTDITDTLVNDTVMVKSFTADAGTKIKILFAGATTGTVTYTTNLL